MAEIVPEDVLEQILIDLDVKDLLRFKSACKSWYSLITSPRFINRHLNRSFNKDRNDNEIGHRRVSLIVDDAIDPLLVGSSNGLVCIASNFGLKVSIANPLTGEETQLSRVPRIGFSLCWGFGYDSSTDDYKVIVKENRERCFRVISLKSNVWRVIEEVKYTFISKSGVLINGALHWIVKDQNKKKLILSFDLSTEEFKEITQPDDVKYECTSSSYLGIVRNCLCVFRRTDCCLLDDLWMMKSYNVKESWERLPHNHNMKHDIVLYLKRDDTSWSYHTLEYHWGCDCSWAHTAAPIFVPSLVSPHVNGRPKQASNIMRRSMGSIAAPPSLVYPHCNERLKRSKVGSIDAPQSDVNGSPKHNKIIRGRFSCALALLKKQSK